MANNSKMKSIWAFYSIACISLFLVSNKSYSIGVGIISKLKIDKNAPADTQLPKPSIIYNNTSLKQSNEFVIEGSARTISINGRTGINATSAHSRIKYFKHTLNDTKGTLSVWLMALEDLAPAVNYPGMKRDNENYNIFPIVTDQSDINNVWTANFSFYINKVWHPGLTAKFIKGEGHAIYNHAAATANHTEFEKYRWYQLSLSWDFDEKELALYINGIKVGSHDVTAEKLIRDVCGDTLYAGNPSLCISEIKFYDKALDNEVIYSIYRDEATDFDEEFDRNLKYTYAGIGRKSFEWKPGSEWEKKLDVTFLQPYDLDTFYVQGYTDGPKITDEGLLIETPNVPISVDVVEQQLYVWTKQTFEGDLYLEYEFKTLRKGGLSLLMTQASGMQREDFMADYPLRTEGNMGMVAWSSVRNYHWEYYREMNDVRNDIACGAMLKNPYQYPLAFGCMDKPLEKNQWHKLQFLQIGNKIIGAIDGTIIIDAVDDSHHNSGSVYSFGRIAIRAMVRTKMMFRNLKVYNRNLDFEILEEQKVNNK